MKIDMISIKERVLIPDLWKRLGLPGEPAASCHSPFRQDKSPSFSIYDGGKRWKDFSTNEGGDAIDFIAVACKIDLQEAARRIYAIAGVHLPEAKSRAPSSGSKIAFPEMHRGSGYEIASVAKTRQICEDSISIAQSLPTLAFGTVCGFACWILSDQSKRIAEARRLDGKTFPALNIFGERKAHTLRGSSKSWPVGTAALHRMPNLRAILLVEGGPDYLAALHFAFQHEKWDVLPVAMLGRSTGTKIDSDALATLAGRRVRIYPHADEDGGGMKSARAWAAQLHAHGCKVDFFDFSGLSRCDGRPVKDLNDATMIHPQHEHQLQDLLP